ncbi:MAG TPA: acyltransferase [Rhizomicrobium sp.]
MQQPSRIPELDGVRGTSAIMVIIAHLFGEPPHGIHALTLGWLCVDVFFVLSGFLIGSIILNEYNETGFFKSFYVRRAARIIPAYALVLVVTLPLAALTAGHIWSDHPFSAWVYGTFTTNFAMGFSDGGGTWMRPTWTLAVEEQFYLLLPLVIYVTPRRLLPSLLIALWLSAFAIRVALSFHYPLAVLTLLPCRMDLLLAGTGVALLNRQFDMKRYLTVLRVIPLVAAFVLLIVALYGKEGTFQIVSDSAASIGIASYLLAIIHGAPEGKRYRSPVLRYLGKVSYTLYLVHQSVSGLLHGLLLGGLPDVGTPAQIAVSLLAIAVSVGLASLSWYWFEAPILRWARNYSTTPHALPASTVVTG